MRQFEIEARPDWFQIATSIPCDFCGAPVGQACIERLAGTHQQRADFHSVRKSSAKYQWELAQIEKTDERIEADLDKLVGALVPHLAFIKIAFTKGTTVAEGPVTLQQGQSTVASIDYFDQTGNPMPAGFTPPTITYSIDNSAVASSTPSSDGQTDAVAYVTAGVANLTATCTSAEGLALTDTETVTCSPVVVPPPVLSSIKINFSAPSAPAAAVKK